MLETLQSFDPGDIVVIHQKGQLKRWQLLGMVQFLTARLTGHGLLPGDRVLLALPNSLELMVSYYACLAAGLVAVPVSDRMAGNEVRQVIAHARPRLLLCSREIYERYEFSGLGQNCPVDILENLALPTTEHTGPKKIIDPWPGHQAAVIFYTSGSTGRPKGILYSHKTLRNNSRIYRKQFNLGVNDRSVLCHCMASNFMFSQALVPFLDAGGSIHIVDFGNLGQTSVAIESGASFLQLVPWFAISLIDHCEAHDIRAPSLRIALAGGDKVPLWLFNKFEQVLGIQLAQNFGMTETNTYSVTPNSGSACKTGSIGLPLTEVEIEIRNPQGHLLPADEVGEIWVNTPAGMDCYWNDKQQTQKIMVEGWYATGDSGHFDEDGVLWFDDRIKNIIICDGDNIYPSELEKEIARHPSVRQVAVFGLPDEARGEVVAAAVVPVNGESLNVSQLRKFLHSRLSDNKIPSIVFEFNTLPLSRSGKTDLDAIRKVHALQSM